MKAENLIHIKLSDNDIGPKGCLSLTKANWSKISTVYLSNYICKKDCNKIGDEGCNHLANFKWKLAFLALSSKYLN